MKDFFAGLNTTAGKIAATALLAVTLTGAAAAPAMAEQVAGDTSDVNVSSVDKSGNNNEINVCVPVNTAVTVVGDAKAVQDKDCKDKESPKPSPSTKPVSDKEELPVTGAPAGIIAGAAALMVAGGIFAVRAARRRGRHAGAAA